jgi:hypothetical protein|tara:strand:+ start:113 stop:706 length:594 start_codon:yes stop_codon:yes gene_type:complete
MATSRPNKNISQFKSKLIGGGARPNLFEVELTTLPANVTANWDSDVFNFMCKAAQLPPQNIANIDVPFRGRIFKVAGDRTIDNWSVTIINDEDFRFRNAFENWTQQIANLDDNMGATDPNSYMTNATVYQLGRGGQVSSSNNSGAENAVLKQYTFQNIWPVNVSAIDLSYDTGDTIEEFTVEFAVQSISLTGAGNPN